MDWTKKTPNKKGQSIFSGDSSADVFCLGGGQHHHLHCNVLGQQRMASNANILKELIRKAGSVLGVEPESGENRAPSAIYTEHHRSSFLPVCQTLRAIISISQEMLSFHYLYFSIIVLF